MTDYELIKQEAQRDKDVNWVRIEYHNGKSKTRFLRAVLFAPSGIRLKTVEFTPMRTVKDTRRKASELCVLARESLGRLSRDPHVYMIQVQE